MANPNPNKKGLMSAWKPGSSIYPFDRLPVQTTDGAEFRAVLKGKLATGESWRCTKRRCQQAAHRIRLTTTYILKMWLVWEGTVEISVNGTSHRLGPGSVGFVRSGDEHGIVNVGSTTATYFVVAIGPGADS